jgi:hypothetical protein
MHSSDCSLPMFAKEQPACSGSIEFEHLSDIDKSNMQSGSGRLFANSRR